MAADNTLPSISRVLLAAILAGPGVFGMVLILAHERVHYLGIFKALGMTPITPASPAPSSPCP